MTGTSFTFEDVAYGVPIRFIADSIELLAMMQQCAPWQQGARNAPTATESPTEFSLYRNGQKLQLLRNDVPCGESDDLSGVLEQLASEVIIHVADRSPNRIFIHAGVIAWNGLALVMPGSSFAGKSTLTAALVQAGATYYSDEYAVLDANGLVHPYARDLSLRTIGGMAQRAVSVDELGGHAGTVPVPVSHIVFAEYSESAIWNPEPITHGEAALAMMQHAIAVQRAPQRVMSTLALMLNKASALRSNRGEAAQTAEILLQMMAEQQAS